MKWIALQGLKGGVGTTTAVAHLGEACHRQGRPVLLLDLSPGNLLRVYLGMPWEVRRGLVPALTSGTPWYQAAYRSATGVQFIPFGVESHPPAEQDYSRAVLRQWFRQIRREAEELQLPAQTLCIVDCPALGPGEELLLQDLVELHLLVVNPDPGCFASLRQREPLPAAQVLINRLHAESRLECDLQDMLLASPTTRVLPVTIQQDAHVPESLAWKQTVFQAAPASQAAQDFALLASWVLSQLREVEHVS